MRSEDLEKAMKLLEKAESDYRESLDELTLASNAVYHGHFICQARFDKVISLRKEVRKLTAIGHELASVVQLSSEVERLKHENESLEAVIRNYEREEECGECLLSPMACECGE